MTLTMQTIDIIFLQIRLQPSAPSPQHECIHRGKRII